MLVTATDVQNNFGKYLRLCSIEPVVITRNGVFQAVLSAGDNELDASLVREHLVDYGTNPRKENELGYRDFIDLTEKSDNRYELIDGVVYQLSSPSFSHQKILGDLYLEFRQYFQDKPTCGPFLTPFDIELIRRLKVNQKQVTEDDINVVQPDLMVLCDYEKDVNAKDKYKGIPTLVVEILSPTNRSNDRIRKLGLYMESGIQECWHVDPKNHTITVYSFFDNEIQEDTIYNSGDVYAHSLCFGGLKALVPL
ncbi:MAG: type II toxin-antitoxin system Phd/YefM family antitoxin [Spirochaetia bacterium]|nr:type II toxin-antitoxin system Phd/YefM family antitoxin [Spirochaetia bacterium]